MLAVYNLVSVYVLLDDNFFCGTMTLRNVKELYAQFCVVPLG